MSLFGELFSWWNGQTLGTRLLTLQRGKLVGSDEVGNRYYEDRRKPAAGAKRRRWVIYAGETDSSRVPPAWHGWLHYTVDAPPTEAPSVVKSWERDHRPNLTGTTGAYHPPGSLYREKQHAPARPYEAWTPE